ncbi:MAG: PAS domain-containing protein [Bacteroidetes bacterium]|nr:PAS domain-containing protein [Fibrella sp.]
MDRRSSAPSPLTIAEQALLWRQLMQHTSGGIFGLEAIRDPETNAIIDFRYRFINQIALGDVFRPRSEPQHDLAGHLFSAYFPSIRQSPLWQLYLEVIDTQQAWQGEGDYLFDGHSLRVQMVISPVNDGVLISYTEISDNHRNRQALERQSARLKIMLDSSPNAIVIFDAVRDEAGRPVDFRFNSFNRLFEEVAQQPADYFVDMPLSKFYPTNPDQMAELVRLMETGEPLQRERYLASRHRWFDTILTRIDDGFVATLRDITGEKQTIAQLERQAQILEGLMNTVQNGLTLLNAVRDEAGRLIDFCYVEASQSLLKGLNLSREEVIGARLLTILPGLRNTTLWPIYLRVLETGVPHQFENHYNTDGFDYYFSLSVARLNDGLVVSYTDITDAKQAQHQLESLVLELRRSNESLDQFAYVASHDLQEPLRKIVSFGDVLQQQFANELSGSAIDLVQRMQNAAGRMRILIQDLLTYSRLTGNPALYEPVALDKVIAAVLVDFGDAILERRAELTISPLPEVRGDGRLLGPLFQNLLSNALKFHRPGQPPRIRITGQLVSNPDAVPTAGRCAEITIRDEGIGFDERYLDRIFTVFQRLHGQQHYAGTGIGLAICKKVAELHGGAISARSQPDAGATFTVWLPAA